MKGKEYYGKNIEDFGDDPLIFNKLEELELNVCCKCGSIESTYELCWLDYWYEGQVRPNHTRKYTAVCRDCKKALNI